jgi:hypothetical protein
VANDYGRHLVIGVLLAQAEIQTLR